MGKNVNVVKNLFILQKNMLQLHTQNSVVPKEESNVNQVAARGRESLDIQKKRYISPGKHQQIFDELSLI